MILHPIKAQVFPYFDDISYVGSPCLNSKDNRISIDTGSSDLWFNALTWCGCLTPAEKKGERVCEWVDGQEGKAKDVLKYDDSLTVKGTYIATTKLYFGKKDAVLQQATFMAATEFEGPNSPGTVNGVNGMVGLGYVRNQQRNSKKYSTLPGLLLANNHTSSIAFSMWFEKSTRNEDFKAQILFGGYATNIYTGVPEVFPIVGDEIPDRPTDIKIQLDQIRFNKDKDLAPSLEKPLPMLLDTGTYSTWLPLKAFLAFVNTLPAGSDYEIDYNAERIYAILDCTTWDLSKTVEFQFGKTIIRVPLTEIVRKATKAEVEDSRARKIKSSKRQCVTVGKRASISNNQGQS